MVPSEVMKIVEKMSQTIERDAQFATLLQHKWQAQIERAVDKVKLSVVPCRKRSKTAYMPLPLIATVCGVGRGNFTPHKFLKTTFSGNFWPFFI